MTKHIPAPTDEDFIRSLTAVIPPAPLHEDVASYKTALNGLHSTSTDEEVRLAINLFLEAGIGPVRTEALRRPHEKASRGEHCASLSVLIVDERDAQWLTPRRFFHEVFDSASVRSGPDAPPPERG